MYKGGNVFGMLEEQRHHCDQKGGRVVSDEVRNIIDHSKETGFYPELDDQRNFGEGFWTEVERNWMLRRDRQQLGKDGGRNNDEEFDAINQVRDGGGLGYSSSSGGSQRWKDSGYSVMHRRWCVLFKNVCVLLIRNSPGLNRRDVICIGYFTLSTLPSKVYCIFQTNHSPHFFNLQIIISTILLNILGIIFLWNC